MSLESVTDEAKEQRAAIEMATHMVLEQVPTLHPKSFSCPSKKQSLGKTPRRFKK